MRGRIRRLLSSYCLVLVGLFANSSLLLGHPINMDAIMQIESSGDANAKSPAGAIGLFQIRQPALTDFNRVHETNYIMNDLYDPRINYLVADFYLQWVWDVCGRNIKDALICYNFGYGNWRKYKRGVYSLPQETLNYIQKYMRLTQ